MTASSPSFLCDEFGTFDDILCKIEKIKEINYDY